MRIAAYALIIALAVSAGCNAPTKPPSLQPGRGYLIGTMEGIPADDVDGLDPATRHQMEARGARFQMQDDGTYTWWFPYPDQRYAILLDDSTVVTPALDAGFELPGRTYVDQKPQSTRLVFEGQVPKSPPPIELTRSESGALEVRLKFHFRDAGCTHRMRNGDGASIEGVCNSCTACIDNNGLWSFAGCRTSRWVGFPGSDCNAAWTVFGLCGYPNDGYCINGRNCSPLIRHSRCWHKG